MRRFKSGRVDSIRASHPEALNWVKAMETNDESKEAKLRLFRLAVAKQTQVTLDNITGKGVDIPMLGIRKAAEVVAASAGIMALFDDPVFQMSLRFKLSTSQVAVNLPDSYMGYGAVVPDGYGVSYNLQNDDVTFCVGSFFSCRETSSLLFATKVQESLLQMKDLFIRIEE